MELEIYRAHAQGRVSVDQLIQALASAHLELDDIGCSEGKVGDDCLYCQCSRCTGLRSIRELTEDGQ